MPPRRLRALSLLMGLCLIPVLLLSPLYLLVTPGYVRHEYAWPGFPPADRFTPQERLRLSDEIVRYIRGRASLAELEALRTAENQPALGPREVQHLVDVRVVLDAILRVHAVALGLAIAAALAIGVTTPLHQACRAWSAALSTSVAVSAGIIAFVVIFSFVDFNLFFTRFHELFFPPETWLFPHTDTLIQLYPELFWVNVTWKLGLIVLAELGLAWALAAWLGRRGRVAAP